MPLSSYGKSVPENNLLYNPIKEEQKSDVKQQLLGCIVST